MSDFDDFQETNDANEDRESDPTLLIGAPYAKCIIRKGKENIRIKSLIAGLPGIGLAGSIAARHMASELNLEVIGFIRSPLILPQAVFFDGILSYPLRIYGQDDGIGIVIAESPISEHAHYYIANAILDWVEKSGIQEIIIIDGYGATSENQSALFVAEPDIWNNRAKTSIEQIKSAMQADRDQLGTGYIGGAAGALLNEAIIRKTIDAFAILAPVLNPSLPSPKAASQLIEIINAYKNLSIDIEGLLAHARKMDRELQEYARRHEQMKKVDATKPFYY